MKSGLGHKLITRPKYFLCPFLHSMTTGGNLNYICILCEIFALHRNICLYYIFQSNVILSFEVDFSSFRAVGTSVQTSWIWIGLLQDTCLLSLHPLYEWYPWILHLVCTMHVVLFPGLRGRKGFVWFKSYQSKFHLEVAWCRQRNTFLKQSIYPILSV